MFMKSIFFLGILHYFIYFYHNQYIVIEIWPITTTR